MSDKRRKRRAVRIGLFIVAGMLLLLPVAGILYLKFADLSVHSARVGRLVSDAIGRELRIEGEFEPEIGWTTTLRAGKVSLANPDWSAEPAMVYAERLKASVDLVSILFGPIRLHDIRIEGARVRVEIAEDDRNNWIFDIESSDDKEAGESDTLGVTFDEIELRSVEVVIHDATWERPLVVQIDQIDAHLVDPETLELDLGAQFAERPLELAGRISSVDLLIEAGPVKHDLAGLIGEDRVAFRGSLADLASLEGPDLTLEMNGPEIGALTEALELPSLSHGPYRLNARTSPAGAKVEVALKAKGGRLEADASGRIESLIEPGDFDFSISASGADLQAAGALAGIEGLPQAPFSVSGQLIRDDAKTSFREVEATLGDTSLSVDGTLGSLPDLMETELRFELSGPDLSVARGLVGLDLPAQPFEARGRLSRQPQGLVFEDTSARVGRNVLTVSGTVGPAPEYAGTDLFVRVDGPDLSDFQELAGVKLPAEPFRIDGHGVYRGSGIAVDSTTAQLGENVLRLDGSVAIDPGLVGSDLRVHVEGPDLSVVGHLADLDDLPAKPFDASGRVRVLTGGYRLDGVEAEVGDFELSLDGRLGPLPELAGTDLRIRASGSDLSVLGAMVGQNGLPGDPYQVAGAVRVLDDGYELEDAEARIGGIELEAAGRVGPLPDLAGTELRVSIQMERLGALGSYLEDAPLLPEEPFSVAGGVLIESDEIELGISGPDLSDVERMLASIDLVELRGMPTVSFSLSGRARATTAGYEIEDLLARVGDDEIRVRGTVGPEPHFIGTDLVVDGAGADGSWIGKLARLPLRERPYRVRGHVQRLESGYRFEDLDVELGDYRADVEGTLGEPPRLEGTDLDVSVEGPDLNPIRRFVDLPEGLDGRFSASGHMNGTPEEFTVERLQVKLDESDLAGSIRVDLRGKPFVYADLASDHLDLASLLGARLGEAEVEAAAETVLGEPAEPATQSPGERKTRLVISDEPFDPDMLGDLNLDLDLSVTQLASRETHVREFEIGVDLLDGKLSVDPLSGIGGKGAAMDGSLVFSPVPEGYELRARLLAENGRLELLGHGDDPALWPEVSVELALAGSGNSPHAVASTLNGWTTVRFGEGRVDNSALGLITADVLATILDTLNPFAKQDPFTTLECGVIHVEFTDGIARLDPLAVRGTKMTIVGNGRVNFANENIDLRWAAKPRKGVGLSASTLTNPYIKLSGTLSDPSLDIKPIEAVTSTGVAVATLGLSVLARGLWDRATAELKVCERGLKQIEKIEARREADKTKKGPP
jgi:uncharacterized protein involved in outer membrane biogenesis